MHLCLQMLSFQHIRQSGKICIVYAWQILQDHSQSSCPSCVKSVALPHQKKKGEQRKQILALITWWNLDLEKWDVVESYFFYWYEMRNFYCRSGIPWTWMATFYKVTPNTREDFFALTMLFCFFFFSWKIVPCQMLL